MDLSIREIERIPVRIPYREIPARHMDRLNRGWDVLEICKVKLACGIEGFGETMPGYTWAQMNDARIQALKGKNAPEVMWDDSVGAGLQMALFDAVGKANDVPCYRLLGNKYRDYAFVGWWAIDMPGEDWLKECKQAMDEGYTNFKAKARPWYSLQDQLRLLSCQLPAWFKLDLDFNNMLVNASNAVSVLTEMEKFPQVAIFEGPIPQNDIRGNKYLRSHTRIPLAFHYNNPPAMTLIREDACDGFVVTGGAQGVTRAGAVVAGADKTLWLQLVGTGITFAWTLHLSAVLSCAMWPSITCHQLYKEQMIHPVIKVSGGMAKVPESPGLGVMLDNDALECCRVKPEVTDGREVGNHCIYIIRWVDGSGTCYSDPRHYWDDFRAGKLPIYSEGVNLECIHDDGSASWAELYGKALEKGIRVDKA